MKRRSSCPNTNSPVWFYAANVYIDINFPCVGQEAAHAPAGRLPALLHTAGFILLQSTTQDSQGSHGWALEFYNFVINTVMMQNIQRRREEHSPFI